MHPLLQIKNLSVSFQTESGNVPAVQDISFEVSAGEIVAVVGESGSGKTVTSLSILQLLPVPPASYQGGQILFSKNGKQQTDMLKVSGDQLRSIRGNQIAMIFQEPMTSLNPLKSCGSQVAEAIQLHTKVTKDTARLKTIDLFQQVGLPGDAFNRYPHQLSGGQKQRVMIAMATSCQPALLIADEPTTALDVRVQKTILHLLKQLQRQHQMGMIYVTHDLGLVAEIADRVVVMYKGSVVETGTVNGIFSKTQHPYTRALLACRPALYAKHQRLPMVSDFIKAETNPVVRDSITHSGDAMINERLEQAPVILQVKNLKVAFTGGRTFFGKPLRKFNAVDDVSFEIKKGETIGLAGESGCGKTTLGRALLRLIEPASGQIYFKGRDITHMPKEEMRRMRKKFQIIFQDPYGSLNPRITIGNAIQEPLKMHGIVQGNRLQKEKVMELLQQVNLEPGNFNRYPHEFSGGQRQRICIARALGLNPDFLICDESVSSLDVSVQAQVLNLLNDLKKDYGFTMVFISHDLGVVRYISDRIMIMNRGKIVETGTAEQIYRQPQNDYTKALIAAIPKGFDFHGDQ